MNLSRKQAKEKALVRFGHSKHRLNSLPLITPLANRLSTVVSETIVTQNGARFLENSPVHPKTTKEDKTLPQKPPRSLPSNPFEESLVEESKALKKSSVPEAKAEARTEVERRQVKRWEPAEPVIDAKIITVNTKVVRNTLIKGQKDN